MERLLKVHEMSFWPRHAAGMNLTHARQHPGAAVVTVDMLGVSQQQSAAWDSLASVSKLSWL